VVGVLPEISVLPLATKANCAPFIIASPQLCPFTTTGRSTCGSEKSCEYREIRVWHLVIENGY
jgi:hypothetical protein